MALSIVYSLFQYNMGDGILLSWAGPCDLTDTGAMGLLKYLSYIQIEGRRGAGRTKLTWKKLMEKDCSEWKLMTVDL